MCVFVLVGQVVGSQRSQWEGLDCLCSPSTAQEEGWKEGEVGGGGGGGEEENEEQREGEG